MHDFDNMTQATYLQGLRLDRDQLSRCLHPIAPFGVVSCKMKKRKGRETALFLLRSQFAGRWRFLSCVNGVAFHHVRGVVTERLESSYNVRQTLRGQRS